MKSVKTFKDFNKDKNELTLSFDGAFLELNDNVSFRIRNISEDVISNTITQDIKTELKPVYGFVMEKAMGKKLSSMSFISLDNHHDPKIYIYKKDNAIVAEVNDRTKQGIDSITIPISSKTFGEWSNPIIINFDKFKTWNLLDADSVKVCYVTDETRRAQAVLSLCKLEDEKTEFYVKIKIISAILKQ